MFVITEAEAAAYEKALELQKAVQDAQRDLNGVPRLGYGATDEEREANRVLRSACQEVIEQAAAAFEAHCKTADFLVYSFKTESNTKINDMIPVGSVSALLTIAEETLGTLESESGERAKALARQLAVRMFNAIGDPEVNQARAQATATRYRALIDAGIPEKLAGEILVAEASRPFPSQTAPMKRA